MQVRRFSEDVKTKVPGGHAGMYAVLWPAHIEHKVWTEDEQLSAIVIDGSAERGLA